MRWLGVVGLAVACGGPQADPEVPCVPFDEIPIVNESGWDETEGPDLIPGVLEAFARDSGHTCLHLTELRVVDYIEPSESGPPFVAGRHRRSSGTILLQSRAGVQTIRHELCHALDHKERITTEVAADIWAPRDGESVDDYAEHRWPGELFARACESGPEDPLDLALREQWGLQTSPRAQYLVDEVWVDAPVADVRFDLDLDLTREVIGEGDPYFLIVTEAGLDVVRDDGEARTLVRHDLDPLTPRTEIPLPDDLFLDGVWIDGDRTWVGGQGRWLQVDDQGITAELDLPGGEAEALTGLGIVLDGRVLTTDGFTGNAVVFDLEDGTHTSAGLPWEPIRARWRDGDDVVLLGDEGTWTGHPDRGWMFDAAITDGHIPREDGTLRQHWVGGVWGGSNTSLVLTDREGLDHFPAEQIPGWSQIWKVGEPWRLVSWEDQQLVLTTLR